MVWKTELRNDVEDQALDDPAKASKTRRDKLIQYFRENGLSNTEDPSKFPQDFSHFSTEDRLILLNISWQIAHSRRQRARQIQSELDNTRKKLDHYTKFLAWMM